MRCPRSRPTWRAWATICRWEGTASSGAQDFALQAQAGIDSLTLGYKDGSGVAQTLSLTLAQLKGPAGSPQKITTDKGELVLSGFDEATGKVSYSYTARCCRTGGRTCMTTLA